MATGTDPAASPMSRLGIWRASYLVALSCIGSFLFAYDTGIVGGVLTLEPFQRDMNFTPDKVADISALSASLLQAGGKNRRHAICYLPCASMLCFSVLTVSLP